ncbi:MAG: flavodoxin domain-containing protein [Planctomycetota bacterium]|jgi:archaetidylinositol phosphate synthase|nr:flavodoxin domain-containing protein [Planctomycetota bacterium]
MLKFPYRKILFPLAKKMVFINPDVLSYLGTVAAFAAMFCYLFAGDRPGLLLWSIPLTLLRMTLNTVDGVIAIERGNLRLRGEIVNALPDRYSDIFVLAGIGLSPLCAPWLGMAGMASMFLVSYTGMLSKAIGAIWQHHGPLGKVERLILVMIFSGLEYFRLSGKLGGIGTLSYFEWLMALFIVLGQFTVLRRLRAQVKECRKLDWLKYRKPDKSVAVVYESQTGNTKKVAEEIAQAYGVPATEVGDAMDWDYSRFDLVVFAVPHLGRNTMPEKMKKLLERNITVKNYALATTSGMPIKRIFSNRRILRHFAEKLGKTPIGTLNIKGFHAIARTFKNHPNEGDLLDSYLFAVRTWEKLK